MTITIHSTLCNSSSLLEADAPPKSLEHTSYTSNYQSCISFPEVFFFFFLIAKAQFASYMVGIFARELMGTGGVINSCMIGIGMLIIQLPYGFLRLCFPLVSRVSPQW